MRTKREYARSAPHVTWNLTTCQREYKPVFALRSDDHCRAWVTPEKGRRSMVIRPKPVPSCVSTDSGTKREAGSGSCALPEFRHAGGSYPGRIGEHAYSSDPEGPVEFPPQDADYGGSGSCAACSRINGSSRHPSSGRPCLTEYVPNAGRSNAESTIRSGEILRGRRSGSAYTARPHKCKYLPTLPAAGTRWLIGLSLPPTRSILSGSQRLASINGPIS